MKASTSSVHGLLEAADPSGVDEPEDGSDGKAGADADTKTVEEMLAAFKSDDVEGVKKALHAYVVHCMSEEEGEQGDEEEEPEHEGGNPDGED